MQVSTQLYVHAAGNELLTYLKGLEADAVKSLTIVSEDGTEAMNTFIHRLLGEPVLQESLCACAAGILLSAGFEMQAHACWAKHQVLLHCTFQDESAQSQFYASIAGEACSQNIHHATELSSVPVLAGCSGQKCLLVFRAKLCTLLTCVSTQ